MIDRDALKAKEDKVKAALDTWDECDRKIAYFCLYNLGHRRDGIERDIEKLAPRKTPGS